MKKRRIWFLLLFVLCGLSVLSGTVWAAESVPEEEAALLAETVASGDCGSGITWRLDVEGVFTVRGKGSMTDYTGPNTVPWLRRRFDIEKVNIEYGVTHIGNNAFGNSPNLTALSVPATVRSIGDSAFAGCEVLSDVTIEEGLREIGNRSFTGCSRLTAFPLPKTVTDMGQSAFSYSGLTEFEITGSVTELRTYLFSNCKDLRAVTLPDTLRTIGQRAFSGCDALSDLTIPAKVSAVNAYAFENCQSFQTAELPAAMTEIADGIFSGCSGLHSVTIPDSIMMIGQNAFFNCNALRDVYYGGTATQWQSVSMADFRDQISRRFIDVHYGKLEAVSDVEIESISIQDWRVTVRIRGNPEKGSMLFVAGYDVDGRFLGAESYPIDDPGAYIVALDDDAHTLTAFVMDKRNRPAAASLQKRVA